MADHACALSTGLHGLYLHVLKAACQINSSPECQNNVVAAPRYKALAAGAGLLDHLHGQNKSTSSRGSASADILWNNITCTAQLVSMG